MTLIFKVLILVEALICFGPLLIFIGFGLIVIPFSVMRVLAGQFEVLFLVAIEIGGILGLVALICVFLHIFNPTQQYISPTKIRYFIVAGFLSLFTYACTVELNLGWYIYLLATILVCIHFLYLGRRYVFYNIYQS
ncbi:hypothetical protein HR060_16645 [Catenovulum sp. SM1970]|uniref:hypothetical protein n=1 Tax=Marinifaba aquimaris TaxID=2741323 RepID=UPI0015725F1C|nr:hypothetical protein [Marinifaba aquimaris]NTS78474.1 hypothetical protein [Marinifaba aquimaris]